MKFQPVSISAGFAAALMLAMLAVHAEPASLPAANPDPCALLKPDDLTTLLGATPVANPSKGSCSWTVTGSPNKKVVATKYPGTGMAADMAFSSARKNAAKGGPVINVTGLGDRAFARVGPFGVVVLIISQGNLLQLLYSPGAPGTDKDIETLRPVAQKAITAL